MSLKTTNPPVSALPLVLGAVNSLANHQQQLTSGRDEFLTDTENLETATPLEVYSMGLTDVIAARLENARPIGWRYLLLQNDLPIAAVEVATSEDSEEVRLSHLNRGQFVEGLAKAVIRAENLDEVAANDYEPRILNIPGVYVMAIWLHGETGDIIIPLSPTFDYLEAEKPYTPETFFAQLKDIADYKLNVDNAPQTDE